MKKTFLLFALLIGATLVWGQIFSTNFNTEASWSGTNWTSYNEKSYSEGGWYFHSTSCVRGGVDESFGGSQYSFRERDLFSIKNTSSISGMSGFTLQLRDWMLGDGMQRDLKVSYNSGQNWETVATINKNWFGGQYQIYQPFTYYFSIPLDFAPEQFRIQITNGGNTNNGRINIGQFQALGEMEPMIIVISPNGGEQWEQGSTHSIVWNSLLYDGNVNIFLLNDEIRTRDPLAENVQNTGSWIWNISPAQIASNYYYILIEGVMEESPSDVSDNYFSIVETLMPLQLTISEIQYTEVAGDGTYPSLYVNEWVQTQGIITAVFYNSFFMQDGAGAWNGINVFPLPTENIAVGNEIVIRGTVTEYFGKTEIINYQIIANNGSMPIPMPISITTGELATEEMYEGVLVRINGVTVTNADMGFGEWEVDDFIDSSGPCVVDDLGDYSYTPAMNDFIYSITGIVDYTYGAYKLQPRTDSDFNFGGFEVNPIALEFFTIGNCIDGLEFMVYNGSSDIVTIQAIDTEGTIGNAIWFINDFSLPVPYDMEAGETLYFLVKIGLPVHEIDREVVTDLLHIQTSAGDYVVTIYFETGLVVSTSEQQIPSATINAANYPNPFNPSTTITYFLPETSQTELTIYNVKGQIVTQLVNEFQNSGNYQVIWNGKNTKNETVSNGIYFFKLTAGKNTITQKMIMLK
jgi:hypothetical protein